MEKHKFRKTILIIQVICFFTLLLFAYYNHKAFAVYPVYADLIERKSTLYNIWSTLWGISTIPGVLCTLGGLPVFILCIVGIIKFLFHRQDKWLLFYSISSFIMEIALLPVWAIWLETHQV